MGLWRPSWSKGTFVPLLWGKLSLPHWYTWIYTSYVDPGRWIKIGKGDLILLVLALLALLAHPHPSLICPPPHPNIYSSTYLTHSNLPQPHSHPIHWRTNAGAPFLSTGVQNPVFATVARPHQMTYHTLWQPYTTLCHWYIRSGSVIPF